MGGTPAESVWIHSHRLLATDPTKAWERLQRWEGGRHPDPPWPGSGCWVLEGGGHGLSGSASLHAGAADPKGGSTRILEDSPKSLGREPTSYCKGSQPQTSQEVRETSQEVREASQEVLKRGNQGRNQTGQRVWGFFLAVFWFPVLREPGNQR